MSSVSSRMTPWSFGSPVAKLCVASCSGLSKKANALPAPPPVAAAAAAPPPAAASAERRRERRVVAKYGVLLMR